MPVKTIQLKGITRTPSDRMSPDGGCAESLNFQIEEQESAPAVEPNLTDLVPDGFAGEVLYIHKGNGYENLIGRVGTKLVWIQKEGGFAEITEVGEGAVNVKSFGNILIAMYADKCTYILFKDGAYKYLGGNIPFPELQFRVTSVVPGGEDEKAEHEFIFHMEGESHSSDNTITQMPVHNSGIFARFEDRYWNYDRKTVLSTDKNITNFDAVKAVQEKIFSMREELTGMLEKFNRPVYLKYTLVLYDGSEIDASPFLLVPSSLGPQGRITFNSESLALYNENEDYRTIDTIGVMYTIMYLTVRSERCCSVRLTKANDVATLHELKERWSDIVKGIRVYASLDIQKKQIDTFTGLKTSRSIRYEVVKQPSHGDSGQVKIFCNGTFELEGDYEKDSFDFATNYYLLNEYSIDDLIAQDQDIDYFQNTERATKQMLNKELLQPKDVYIPSDTMEYNGRLLAGKMKTVLYPGKAGASSFYVDERIVASTVTLYYFVRGELGRTYIAASKPHINPGSEASFVHYPNLNCFKVVIKDSDSYLGDRWFEIPMNQSVLDGSSVFFDFDKPTMFELLAAAEHDGRTDSGVTYLGKNYRLPDFSNEMVTDSRVYQTKVGSFYIYDDFQDLAGSVIGLSVNTTALSAGQHGQFPIIAFTTEGIFGINIAQDGSFAGVTPMPRDIALENCIWQADDATVFATPKSVQIIAGSQVMDIAPYMGGKHYSLDEQAAHIMNDERIGYASLTSLVTDNETTFQSFMEKAQMSFDYNGQRLIFFHEDKAYAYVYRIKSATWHKIALPAGVKFSNTLNSYPDALVVMEKHIHEDSAVIVKLSGSISDEDGFSQALSDEGLSEYEAPLLHLSDGSISEVDVTDIDAEQKETLVDICRDWGMVVVVTDLDKDLPSVYDYSSILDDSAYLETSKTTKGVIITRSLNFDAPDVLKTINHIRIRGDYEKERNGKPAVSYILLASQDGKKWWRLGSLRGKSWKMFRIVILADLKPTERISWLEIDYETRFTNKPR